jgi:rod shape-determining protein MreC
MSTVLTRLPEPRRHRILLAALVLGHLVVISRQVEGDKGTSLLEQTVLAALSPFQRLAAAAVGGVVGTWRGYVDLRAVHETNRTLSGRVRDLELDLQRTREQVREAERLRRIAELGRELPFSAVAARVVATDGVPWFRTVMIDRGHFDGVDLNMAVISAQGVVGRVTEVGPHAARVQLLLDQNSGVGARIERSRITGVVSGQAGYTDAVGNELQMKYVPVLADVVEGDVVVTSGLDRIYPRGLTIGRVRAVRGGGGLFKEITVAPSARFERLEELIVLKTPAPDLTVTRRLRPDPSPEPRGR